MLFRKENTKTAY